MARRLKAPGRELLPFVPAQDIEYWYGHRMKREVTPRGVLYISYDGILEPLGQSQVLAYLEHLARTRPIHLLSFEKPEDWRDEVARAQIQARMDAAGIRWHPRRYHKWPSAVATAWDILIGSSSALWLTLRHRLRIVHARSYVPALMALVVKRLTGVRYLFDMRGFWADERLDGGLWPREGRLYRITKSLERRFLLSADHVVSLTHAAVREMRTWTWLSGRMPPTTVISTCADLVRFAASPAPPDKPFIVGYVGSAGTWYLFDEAVACFGLLRGMRPDARWLIVNRGEHEFIRRRLEAAGVPAEAVELRTAEHSEMPQQMARMHVGMFFIKPFFSKQASAPTKLGEFLGCGIPCLANAGVGDMADILEGERVGVAINQFDEQSMREGLHALLALVDDPSTRVRCVAAAHKHFLLEEGVARYAAIYEKLDELAA